MGERLGRSSQHVRATNVAYVIARSEATRQSLYALGA
jgi:hypothetical protein